MKMRNLLRSIPFLLLMMSGLSLVFNCNGINSNSSQTLPPATVTVTFTVKGGNGTLTAKAGNTELTSPASVKKDTDVAFTPNPNSGYEVDYLLINGVKKSGTTVTVKADKNITAIVKFKTQGAPETQLFTVDYKAEPAAGGSISAKYSDGTAFSSGGKIETGTSLVFTAEPNSGYTISAWAGATESPDKKTATLTVTANSSVTVMFAEKQYMVTFDARNGTPPVIQQVKHGKTVIKPTDPVKPSFSFGGWYKEEECITLWNFASDTVTSNCTLYAKWQSPPITIRFDSDKMTCKKNGNPVNNNDTVYENDMLHFEATLPPGQTVDKWTVNGVEKEYATESSFWYKVQTADAQGGIITIGYTEKIAQQVTIRFDSDKMTCKKNGNPVNNNDTVYENDMLHFEATLPPGQTVDKWTVNGVEKEYATESSFWYKVQTADAQGGIITIGYTEKIAQQVTIHFDSSKMVCWKNPDANTLSHTLISDGDSVYENDFLLFMAKPAAGKMVDSWTQNTSSGNSMGNSFFYQVKAQPSVLNIDYTEKTAEKLTLQFDTSNIQCKKLVDDSPIAPGLLDAGDILVFSTKNGSAVTWKANNTLADPYLPKLKHCILTFTKEMAQNYGNEHTLTISYDE